MNRFAISNRVSSHCFGIYDAETPADAIQAMRVDAGYRDAAHVARELGLDPETVDDDIVTDEIPDVAPLPGGREAADRNLVAYLDDGDEPEFFEAMHAGGRDGYHVAYLAADHGAVVVHVGPGSDGRTSWTDCRSPQEAVDRYVTGDMNG